MTSALQRVIQRGATHAPRGERCDLCSAELAEDHRHLLDTDHGEALCTCPSCTILFDRPVASDGHYRLIPRRRVRLPEVDTEPLGVPVGLAYFVPHADGGVIAHYPSPVGATEWAVDSGAWAGAVAQNPRLRDIEPAVEALLVQRARGAREHWLVPVDDCYRLVAIIRREWKGLSGGSTVWPAIDRFFATLTERDP
jgi:Family of unknown function (DUF5947)